MSTTLLETAISFLWKGRHGTHRAATRDLIRKDVRALRKARAQ